MVRTNVGQEAFFSLKMAENGPKMTRKKKRSFFHDARDSVMMPCVRYWKNPKKTGGDIAVRTNLEFVAFV